MATKPTAEELKAALDDLFQRAESVSKMMKAHGDSSQAFMLLHSNEDTTKSMGAGPRPVTIRLLTTILHVLTSN